MYFYISVCVCVCAGFGVHYQAETLAANQELHGGDFFSVMDQDTSHISCIYTEGWSGSRVGSFPFEPLCV